MLKTETVVGGFFLAAWLAAAIYLAGGLPPPGLALSFYGLYSFAAAFGWVAGNLWVLRRRRLAPALRARFGVIYFLLPAGVVVLARAMAPLALRAAAPLALPLALGVYAVFFLVPLSFGRRS